MTQTAADKLIDAWTLYASSVGCEADTNRKFAEVSQTIGHKQFIKYGLDSGLNMNQIKNCWDFVELNLICRR